MEIFREAFELSVVFIELVHRASLAQLSCAVIDISFNYETNTPLIARLVLAIHLLHSAIMTYGYVYMICNRKNGTIYLGMTTDLDGRMQQHKSKSNPKSFSARYDTIRLVWFERHDLVTDAITQEKTMKGWPRQWKINLIERDNPNWDEVIMDWDD